MRSAFSGKRRTSSSAPIIILTEVEPGMRSELLRSSIDSPNVTPASIAELDSMSGTTGSTSGNSYRSAFVRPFMPSRSKTVPTSPLVNQEVDSSRKSSIRFSSPWSNPRNLTAVSGASSVAAEAPLSPNSPQRSQGLAFIRRFSSSRTRNPAVAESLDTPDFSASRASSMRSKVVRRTVPYGPPYNFPMPGANFIRREAAESCQPHIASDPVLVVQKKKLKRFRKFRTKGVVTALSRQYPQDDLAQVLDHKLSALHKAQKLDSGFPTKYIWGPDSDASPEPFGMRTGSRGSVTRRVVSDSRSMMR